MLLVLLGASPVFLMSLPLYVSSQSMTHMASRYGTAIPSFLGSSTTADKDLVITGLIIILLSLVLVPDSMLQNALVKAGHPSLIQCFKRQKPSSGQVGQQSADFLQVQRLGAVRIILAETLVHLLLDMLQCAPPSHRVVHVVGLHLLVGAGHSRVKNTVFLTTFQNQLS